MTITSTPAAYQQHAIGGATRERIVEVAADLMLVDGVAATTIADVKAAARVSASQIYHYFGSKVGLVRAVVDHIAARRAREAAKPYPLDSIAGLRAWAASTTKLQVQRGFIGGCELGSLAAELAETDDELRLRLADAFEGVEQPLRHALHAMRARGEFDPDVDTDALATALVAAAQGGTLLAQLRRDDRPLRIALNVTLDHVERLHCQPQIR